MVGLGNTTPDINQQRRGIALMSEDLRLLSYLGPFRYYPMRQRFLPPRNEVYLAGRSIAETLNHPVTPPEVAAISQSPLRTLSDRMFAQVHFRSLGEVLRPAQGLPNPGMEPAVSQSGKRVDFYA